MAESERSIQNRIMIEVSKLGHTVFRNNTGKFQDARGVWVAFGLCVGGSDLIGWTKEGKFLAIEVKRPGQNPTKEQLNFIHAVNKGGGVGFVADKVEDIYSLLKQ